MLRLRDFMTRDVATLSPEDTLRDAMALFAERYITGAPVVSRTSVIGVVSTMDIMDFAASHAGASRSSGDEEEWALDDVPSDMASSYYTDLWDQGADMLGEDQGNSQDLLSQHTVGEVMTRNVLLLPPETEVHEAAAFMIEHGVHRVLVAEDGNLQGLVSTTDFLRLIAERRL
jgi:CBS domain-containing protein